MEPRHATRGRRARLVATMFVLTAATIIGLPTAAAAATTPTFSAWATQPSNQIADNASIYAPGPAPTGTITFVLYGPDDPACSRSPAFVSVRSVSGNAIYASGFYVPSAPGTYRWVAAYSGDANYTPAATVCGDPYNTVVIGGNRPVPVTASPTSVRPGQALNVHWSGIQNPTSTDWVALYAVGDPDSAIRAWRYTSGASTGDVSLTVPGGTPPGSYEVRLFYNNSMVRLGTSNVVTVTA